MMAGNFAENMMKMRNALHWSMKDLAEESSIPQAKIFRIEHGSRIYLEEAIAIAKAFGVTVNFMLVDHEDSEITSRIKMKKS
jgi:transcriptional regulator with XRE-family HTH domain